jgi:hypothetical protein
MQRIRHQAASTSIGADGDESTNAASLLLWLVLHDCQRSARIRAKIDEAMKDHGGACITVATDAGGAWAAGVGLGYCDLSAHMTRAQIESRSYPIGDRGRQRRGDQRCRERIRDEAS